MYLFSIVWDENILILLFPILFGSMLVLLKPSSVFILPYQPLMQIHGYSSAEKYPLPERIKEELRYAIEKNLPMVAESGRIQGLFLRVEWKL